jgi:hypothetical protein
MPYQYDIFISYRRDTETRNWIENHFVPLLEHHIKLDIGRDPKIFIDSQLEAGTTWPISLGKKLGESRTLIPLWTKTFLNSDWCKCEIGHMLEREKLLGLRTIDKPGGLIFPTVIHDGDTMPVELKTIQKVEIQECYCISMRRDSERSELLEDKLRSLACEIAQAIENAPGWQDDWGIQATNDFVKLFNTHNPILQNNLPRFG